jgi:hypothetical protein
MNRTASSFKTSMSHFGRAVPKENLIDVESAFGTSQRQRITQEDV